MVALFLHCCRHCSHGGAADSDEVDVLDSAMHAERVEPVV
jgi:hypothetical protein